MARGVYKAITAGILMLHASPCSAEGFQAGPAWAPLIIRIYGDHIITELTPVIAQGIRSAKGNIRKTKRFKPWTEPELIGN